jgi:hypothetical protein
MRHFPENGCIVARNGSMEQAKSNPRNLLTSSKLSDVFRACHIEIPKLIDLLTNKGSIANFTIYNTIY